MKKIICILLTFIMLCGLVACGNNAKSTEEATLSPEEIKQQEDLARIENVKKLIEELDSISDASYDSEQKILEAEQAYNELDDSLKKQVDNYEKIAKVKKIYEYFHYCEIAKSKAVSSIKSNLKNPGSYEEVFGYSIMYYDAEIKTPLLVAVKITYSATNSFGGRLQEKYQIFYEIKGGKLSSAKPYVDLKSRVNELGAVEIDIFDLKGA